MSPEQFILQMPSGQFRVDIPGFEYDRGAEISLADSWLHAQEHLRCQGMDKSYRIQTRRGSLNCRRVPQCWMLSGVQGTLKFRGAGGTDGSVAHGFHCTNCPSTAADFPSLTCLFVKRSSLSLSHAFLLCPVQDQSVQVCVACSQRCLFEEHPTAQACFGCRRDEAGAES